jgi:hypothetical protein
MQQGQGGWGVTHRSLIHKGVASSWQRAIHVSAYTHAVTHTHIRTHTHTHTHTYMHTRARIHACTHAHVHTRTCTHTHTHTHNTNERRQASGSEPHTHTHTDKQLAVNHAPGCSLRELRLGGVHQVDVLRSPGVLVDKAARLEASLPLCALC